MNTKLIVFEGIDNSGKTTLSKLLQSKLNNYIWSKEPIFTTEIADQLNSENCKDQYKREVLFLESRLNKQDCYKNNNVILDRYLWSGLSYAKCFSPDTFNFVKILYQNYRLFKKPDITIFIDTPVEICQSREPELTLDRLNNIRNAYIETEKYVNTPIIKISGTESIDTLVDILYNKIILV